MDEIDKFSGMKKEQNINNDSCYISNDNLINIKEGEIPMFANMVFNDKYLNKSSINTFIKKFWNKYINPENIEFRKSVVGKYLFWFNKKFIGVIDNIDDCDTYGNSMYDTRYLIQISNYCECAY